MKKIFFSLLLFFCIGSVLAQVTPEIKSNWETTLENNEVEISKRTVQVNDVANGTYISYVQLKYQNKTAKQLFVSFYIDAKYTGNSTAKSNLDDEDYRAFLLEPNQAFVPNFSTQNEKMHFVFKKLTNYTDKPTLTSVTITKLKTNIIK